MYTVKEWHYRPSYKRKCHDVEEVITNIHNFKTLKSANKYIEGKLKGKLDSWRNYHKGNEKSYCGYYTGKTWINENNGETYKEAFIYELSKEQIW